MVSSSYRMTGFCLKIWLSVQTKGFYLELLSEPSHPATYVPICLPFCPRTHPLICLLIHLALNSALGRKFNDRRCGLRSQPSVDPNLRGGNRNHPSLLSPRSLPDIRLSGIQIDTRAADHMPGKSKTAKALRRAGVLIIEQDLPHRPVYR